MEHTLLYVHQEQWQKDLLLKYGNTISLIDATYKTTKYNIALFFICVKTNVGYCVVAEFVIQSEASEQIAEALNILRSWNTEWNPKYFMTDYSEAEYLALKTAFPGIKIFLCDFHREQAWERWVKDSKHGLSKEEAQHLLHILRTLANETQMCHFVSHLNALKESNVWIKHHSVREWLNHTSLCITEV